MKKVIIGFSASILIFVIIIVYSMNIGNKNNNVEINVSIKNEINKSKPEVQNIAIVTSSMINEKNYVLFTFDEKLGYAEYDKTIIGRLKFNNITFDFEKSRSEVISTKRGKYLIVVGKRVSQAERLKKVVIDSITYELELPDKEYYIVSCPVPEYTKLGVYLNE